jgi:hypothetical protein
MDPSTATKMQVEAYQKMSGEERLRIALTGSFVTKSKVE